MANFSLNDNSDSSDSSSSYIISSPYSCSRSISIEELYTELVAKGCPVINKNNKYSVLNCAGKAGIRTKENKFVDIKYISKHTSTKDIIKLDIAATRPGTTTSSSPIIKSVKITTDHVCMVYNRNHFLENTDAKNLKIGDIVSVYDKETNTELVGTIQTITNLGPTAEYLYDMEVDIEGNHCFYANDILIHNSNFLNIACITDYFKTRFGYKDNISEWSDDEKLQLWKFVNNLIENKLNKILQKLIAQECHSEETDMLQYSLEYIADCGIYEAKKHYGVHKIIEEGPELSDKLKFSGIELKKSSISKEIKTFLRDIYLGILKNNWDYSDFSKYLCSAYEKFITLSIDEISLWKGWNSDKIETSGFLQATKGMTGISKACHNYNDMIKQLKLSKKYDYIIPGNKVKFCYINPSNEYGIDTIAFPSTVPFPEELTEYFKPDYDKMFQKNILQPLGGFFAATKFPKTDPRCQAVFDIDLL